MNEVRPLDEAASQRTLQRRLQLHVLELGQASSRPESDAASLLFNLPGGIELWSLVFVKKAPRAQGGSLNPLPRQFVHYLTVAWIGPPRNCYAPGSRISFDTAPP